MYLFPGCVYGLLVGRMLYIFGMFGLRLKNHDSWYHVNDEELY